MYVKELTSIAIEKSKTLGWFLLTFQMSTGRCRGLIFLWPRPDANIHGVFTLPELFPKPSVDDTFWSEMEQLEVINICLGGVSYISLGWQHPSSKMAPTQFLCQNSAAVGQKVDEEKNWEKEITKTRMKKKITSQELRMLSRSLTDRKSLLLNVMIQVLQFVSNSQICN